MAGQTTSQTSTENNVVAEKNSSHGAGIILFVEDDPSVRSLVARLLTLHGYQILAAENGRAALPIWEEHKRSIKLLLTDVVMPHGVSGRELAAHCQAENASLQVIYTSGYNVELSADDGWLPEGIRFVQKPYRPEQLLEAVRNALSALTPTP